MTEKTKAKPKDIKLVLSDRAILHEGPFRASRQAAVFIALTDNDQLLLLDGSTRAVVYAAALSDIVKVRGMTSYLKFYMGTNPAPLRVQLLPALRDPHISKGMMNNDGAIGSLYQEKKMEKLSNIKLWVNMLREYNIDVKYKPFNVVVPATIIITILAILLIAILSFILPVLVGILQELL